MNSRFDRAVRGEKGVLTPLERRGFTVFMGKAACGTCHFAPLFSGDTPPLYLSSDVEVIGTSVSPKRFAALDPDSGRAGIDHLPAHLRAFKTPSLRNITLTAPYMHHGTFATLDEVIRFYDGGGGLGAGAPIAKSDAGRGLAAPYARRTRGDCCVPRDTHRHRDSAAGPALKLAGRAATGGSARRAPQSAS